jgi:predicted DsbA family dithiol-disulfide isomerase
MAELVALERDDFLDELDDPVYADAVAAETAGAREAGIDSAPTLVINGEVSAGVPDWEDLRTRIEETAAASWRIGGPCSRPTSSVSSACPSWLG